MGRTGRFFAHEFAGISPDIMAIAKGIGGGFPMGACLSTERVGSAMGFGAHGSTFGGNPLAMAVGNAVLDVVLADGFFDQVRARGVVLMEKLGRLRDRYPAVVETVRGAGLMVGLKCRVPNADVISACHAERLLAIAAGDNVVRLLPPLIVTEAEIGEAVERLERACAAVAASLPARATA
jgi:acetylornithine/N-succinyldiaminopimelate aminotransferase